MNSANTNVSQNTASNSSSQIKPAAWCFAYGVIGIITILSNSLTITVFMRKNFQRKKLHYLLINLAVTDLTVGAISVPLQMADFIAELHNTRISQSAIKAHYVFDVLSGLTSMYSIAFISVERLIAVCWPLKHRLLKLWHYSLAISLTWLIAGTVAIVSNEILAQRISYLEKLNVRTVFAVIPIIVTIASYCFLLYIRKGHGAKSHEDKCNKSIACTLLIVTIVFFCTWSPFIILSSTVGYVSFSHLSQCCSLTKNGYMIAQYFTKLLQYSNSCVNPFIYALRIHSFRCIALEILRCSKTGKLHFIGSRKMKTSGSSTSTGDIEMRTILDIKASEICENETYQSKLLVIDQQL